MYILEIYNNEGKMNEHHFTTRPKKEQIAEVAAAYDHFKYAKIVQVYTKKELAESEEK